MPNQSKPTYLDFDLSYYPWKTGIDYKANPDLYLVGKGEQGVLICEPYKTEIGQFWRFKDTVVAQESSQKIFQLFLNYLSVDDFVGADMARKYLQMGYTRARRYANYKGGKKYDKANEYAQLTRGTGELEKAKAASIFYDAYKKAETNPTYTYLKKDWKKRLG